LSMMGMTTLLRNCIERADWESGREVWDQIKLVQLRSRRRGVAEKIQLRTYATMLHLCLMCEQENDYDEIFDEAMLAGHAQSGVLNNLRNLTKRSENESKPASQESAGRVGDAMAAVSDAGHTVNDTFPEKTRQHDHSTQPSSRSRQEIHRRYEEPIRQEQLWGDMTASQDLDVYENTERPMHLYL